MPDDVFAKDTPNISTKLAFKGRKGEMRQCYADRWPASQAALRRFVRISTREGDIVWLMVVDNDRPDEWNLTYGEPNYTLVNASTRKCQHGYVIRSLMRDRHEELFAVKEALVEHLGADRANPENYRSPFFRPNTRDAFYVKNEIRNADYGLVIFRHSRVRDIREIITETTGEDWYDWFAKASNGGRRRRKPRLGLVRDKTGEPYWRGGKCGDFFEEVRHLLYRLWHQVPDEEFDAAVLATCQYYGEQHGRTQMQIQATADCATDWIRRNFNREGGAGRWTEEDRERAIAERRRRYSVFYREMVEVTGKSIRTLKRMGYDAALELYWNLKHSKGNLERRRDDISECQNRATAARGRNQKNPDVLRYMQVNGIPDTDYDKARKRYARQKPQEKPKPEPAPVQPEASTPQPQPTTETRAPIPLRRVQHWITDQDRDAMVARLREARSG